MLSRLRLVRSVQSLTQARRYAFGAAKGKDAAAASGHDHDHDHDDHGHGHEVIRPGQEGGWAPNYDWRRDPCLEWGYDDHHGHGKPDWRDNPKYNPDLYQDGRDIGFDPSTYTFPYTGTHDSTWWFPNFPTNYQSTDLTTNLRPEFKKSDLVFGSMPASYGDMDEDAAHEYDYESEDADFQPETFKMQHFRKKGPISQWVFVGFLPVIYFYIEFLYNHYPDEDNWRIPHPPPLEYPDPDDSDDMLTIKDYNTKTGKYLRDSGIIDDIWFDVKDGKKIYRRFAGVNQPLEDL